MIGVGESRIDPVYSKRPLRQEPFDMPCLNVLWPPGYAHNPKLRCLRMKCNFHSPDQIGQQRLCRRPHAATSIAWQMRAVPARLGPPYRRSRPLDTCDSLLAVGNGRHIGVTLCLCGDHRMILAAERGRERIEVGRLNDDNASLVDPLKIWDRQGHLTDPADRRQALGRALLKLVARLSEIPASYQAHDPSRSSRFSPRRRLPDRVREGRPQSSTPRHGTCR